MIAYAYVPRAAMATLHCDPSWSMFVHAWRAYEMPDVNADLLLYIQSATTSAHLRVRFPALPRLHVSSMDNMVSLLVDSPGLMGQCIFNGGHFTRNLRRVNRNLHARFEDVVEVPALPAMPAPREVVDLTFQPETPILVCRSPPLTPP